MSQATKTQLWKFCVAIVEEAVVDEADEDYPPFVPVLHTIMEADGWCYVEIQKAMYGLKESGFIANQELKTILGKQGYIPSSGLNGVCLNGYGSPGGNWLDGL